VRRAIGQTPNLLAQEGGGLQSQTALSETPSLAIVICCKDRAPLLEGALVAVERAKREEDEIIVVDSASADGSVQEVAARAGVAVVRCEEPGHSRARNAGIRGSSAPVIAFTDDDCRPEPGWTDLLAAPFRDEPRTGFVTGKVVPDRDDGPVLSVGGGDDPLTFVYGVDPAGLGHGANFAVRRDAIEAVGGFDEALGIGGRLGVADDCDAFWRILRDGWVGRYEPRALVVHNQWRSRRQYLRSQYGYGLGGGALAVKALRLEGRDGSQLLKDRLWRYGAVATGRALRSGNKTGAAGDALRLVASVIGATRAWRAPLDAGRFSPR
jgi:glycosyltransferase involved in cell wall biosynthesis